MSRIIITTDDQNLLFTNMPDIYSGDVNYDEVEFIFDNTWNSMSKTAVFFTKETKDKPKGILITSSNIVKIPSELIADKCTLFIGLYGVLNGKTIKTSQIIKYDIGQGSPINTQEIEEVEEKFWEQVLSELNSAQQSISTINSNITNINSKISTNTSNISKNTSDISKNANNITTNTNDIKALKEYDTTNTSNINTINNNINSINGEISTINTNISSIQTDVDNLKTNVSALQTKMGKIEIATISEVNTYLGI